MVLCQVAPVVPAVHGDRVPTKRIALLVCIAALQACGSHPATPRDQDDDQTGDSDCVTDACGVCDGDGTTCAPQPQIVIVLEVEGAVLATFPFVSSLGSASELITLNDNQTIPGKPLPGSVTLVRTANDSLVLAQWREAIDGGSGAMQTATLTLSDSLLGTIAKWELTNAWPSALDVSHQPAGLRESLTITYDGITRVSP